MKQVFFYLSMAGLLFLAGCAKETKTTSAGIVFWQTQSNAIALGNSGVTSLTFYVAGNLVASQAASVYYNVAPDCQNPSAPKGNIDLGGKTQQTMSWQAKDQNGIVVYDGTITLNSGDCLQMQLN